MIERISPEEANEKLDSGEGYVYIDVRDIHEFEAGHPEGAHNVPVLLRGPGGMMMNADFVAVCEANFAKDQKIITGCLRGGRSLKAAEMLIAAGFHRGRRHAGRLRRRDGPGRRDGLRRLVAPRLAGER